MLLYSRKILRTDELQKTFLLHRLKTAMHVNALAPATPSEFLARKQLLRNSHASFRSEM